MFSCPRERREQVSEKQIFAYSFRILRQGTALQVWIFFIIFILLLFILFIILLLFKLRK